MLTTTIPTDTILCGDALSRLRELPDGCVQTVITSPPYYGLRDYGTATWEGGLEDCDHVQMAVGMSDKNTLGPSGYLPETNAANVGRVLRFRDVCGKCGARRIDQQIGLEETPEQYVARLVAVFREVRRVLRSDGTLWCNIGDSYFGDSPARKASSEAFSKTWDTSQTRSRGGSRRSAARIGDLKPKDLIGVPWLLAFALRADGWWLRSDIVWHKPNPMPESVTDRPTRSHEYIFLLSKSERYFYDGEAIREDAAPQSLARIRQANFANQTGGPKDYRITGINVNRSMRQTLEHFAANPGRNKRTVWTVATAPYAGAHFATFPPALIEPCILAGSRPGDVVLDPFAGSGTTCAVAKRHSRHWLGVELNPAYIALAEQRIARELQPVLWSATTVA